MGGAFEGICKICSVFKVPHNAGLAMSLVHRSFPCCYQGIIFGAVVGLHRPSVEHDTDDANNPRLHIIDARLPTCPQLFNGDAFRAVRRSTDKSTCKCNCFRHDRASSTFAGFRCEFAVAFVSTNAIEFVEMLINDVELVEVAHDMQIWKPTRISSAVYFGQK